MTETVRDIGEFGLIDRLVAALPPEARATGEDVIVAAGDDAAVLRVPPGEVQVVTADALVEGIHFRLDWTDWESLGHRALAVNLSDIAGMGENPATRSGPHLRIVCTWAAAMISIASSQFARTSPPLPRARL